jgi:hypothetical protein
MPISHIPRNRIPAETDVPFILPHCKDVIPFHKSSICGKILAIQQKCLYDRREQHNLIEGFL